MSKTKSFFTKNKLIYLGTIVLVMVVGIYYKSTHPSAIQVQYKTAVAEKGTLTTSVSGSGNIAVDQSSNIDPTITGAVSNLSVTTGDTVKKGQLLFVIDNNDLSVSVAKSSASFAQAQSSVQSAEASLAQVKADLSDAKKSDSGKSSAAKKALREKVEAAEASLNASHQNLNAAGADLGNQRRNAGKRNVTSPIDGTVNAVNIKNGDDLSKLSSGSSRLVPIIIGDLGTLKAQVQVNEVDIPNVSIGQKAMLTFGAIDNFSLSGKVEKMDSLGTITQGVVTYSITIGFDALDPRIKPGMSVSASIIIGVKQDVINVPNSAVKTQDGVSYIEILVNQTPQQKPVEIGASNNTDTEIIRGVAVGDTVVTQTITSGTFATSSTSSNQRSGFGGGGGLRLPGVGR